MRGFRRSATVIATIDPLQLRNHSNVISTVGHVGGPVAATIRRAKFWIWPK